MIKISRLTSFFGRHNSLIKALNSLRVNQLSEINDQHFAVHRGEYFAVN